MKTEDDETGQANLINIYSGTEASAMLIKSRLERIGISSIIKKDSNAGTWGIVPDNIDLFIEPSDRKEAKTVIDEFMQTRKVEKL